jgi:N-acetylmuramoyl-L-alanine amidase
MKWLIEFISKIFFLFKKEPVRKSYNKTIKKEDIPIKQFRVVIDPGHGGKDDGASTEDSKEKELNMIFSNNLFDLLEQDYHFIPLLTRDRDEYRSLKYRVDFAKQNSADIFISMHCNASLLQKPNDCQIFYHSETKDKSLAEILFKYVDKIDHNTSRWSREIKANFYVLRNLANEMISAVLVEIGFLSNEDDEKLLNDEDFQRKFCEGLYNGIKNYFNV